MIPLRFEASVRIFECVSWAALVVVVAGGCSTGYAPRSSDADAGTDSSLERDGFGSADTAGFDTNSTPDPDGGVDGSEEDTTSNTCTPEGDGSIQREEVPLRAGLQATFRVAEDVEVDTQGTKKDGERHWDYSGDYPGDSAELIALESVEGRWFASDYPEADYAMKLAGGSEELGVFQTTEDALLLLGVVSPDDDTRKTNISYDPPVEVLKFPLEEGASWKTETEASGTHKTWSPFTPITYQETYTNQVDARGTVVTPYGSFDALRVRTKLERSGSATGVPFGTIRTFAFVAECFGTIVTIRSKQGESETEFNEAAELRRLAQ